MVNPSSQRDFSVLEPGTNFDNSNAVMRGYFGGEIRLLLVGGGFLPIINS